jgi:multidrug efflux pump subunit AcrA (membrane-fusion protein)
MRAQADAEAARAELEALKVAQEAEISEGKVVYERTDELADYESAVASLESGNGALRDAI